MIFVFTVIQTVSGWIGVPPKHIIRIDKSQSFQTMEGFGTSSAWWAQTIENRETADLIAKLLYNKESGLGLDIFRYNIGAGEKNNPNSIIAIEDRKTDSFYVWDESAGSYVYDFSRDENARYVLDAAVKNGATKIILFCNSPHFSITKNGLASGSREEGVCNLPEENYQAFVDYVLAIADHFVSLGYPIYGVSPINEPQWNWGTGWISQEGCHYSPEEAIKLLEAFALTMQERGVPYKLLGPESGQMSEGFAAYEEKFLNSSILSGFCDTFSGHSYWMDGQTAEKEAAGVRLQSAYASKMKYEMSEWCELPLRFDSTTIESGLYMANVMWEDLSLLNAVSWQSWTAVNGDGLLDRNGDDLTVYKRYYIMKQFSSFIPLGAVRIGTIDSYFENSQIRTLAFRAGNKTILIAINNADTPETVSVRGAKGSLSAYITDAGRNCEQIYLGEPGNITLPEKSISTLVFSGTGC